MQEQYTPQDIHDWKFASELSEYTLPVFPDKNAAQLILIRKAFPDKSGVLETAYESLTRYFAAAGYRFTSDEKKLTCRLQRRSIRNFARNNTVFPFTVPRSKLKPPNRRGSGEVFMR